MLIIIDPQWAANKELLDGTVEFLDYIRAALPVRDLAFETNVLFISKPKKQCVDCKPKSNLIYYFYLS